MSTSAELGEIPAPETLAKRQLARAPKWLRRAVSNILSILAWVGLPSTLLSTLSSLQIVIDGALWLYRNAGALRPALRMAGEGVVVLVEWWRALTHPLWEVLFSWLDVALPAWAPDVLTLLLLFMLGLLRRATTEGLASFLSETLMLSGQVTGTTFQRIPRAFPYQEHFEENGFRLPPRRLRETRRLWRKWRKAQIRLGLGISTAEWPRYPEATIRAQFGRYWLGVRDGRRAMLVYCLAGTCMAGALGIDWAYRVGLFQ